MHSMRQILKTIVVLATLTVATEGILAKPQAPARDARPTLKTGTGRVRGRVLVAGSSDQPARRAVVQLLSPTGAERSAISDTSGKFEFVDLPPGRFRLSASKDGCLPGRYGSRRIGDLGGVIELKDGQTFDRADIILFHACAIGGRVLDEFGDPVMNANISVMKRQTSGATRRFTSFKNGKTDDLGRYRVSGLEPGRYYVIACPVNRTPAEASDANRDGYARTYYPGTTDVAQAQAVLLGPGQEATADTVLVPVRLGRVSGKVLDAHARPVGDAWIGQAPGADGLDGLAGGARASLKPDGTFLIYDVLPGEYVLHVMGRPGSVTGPWAVVEHGFARVTVAGGLETTGVTIHTSSGAIVSGRVTFEGGPSPISMKGVNVSTVVTDLSDTAAPVRTDVNADGLFELASLFGHQAIRVNRPPAGWALKAVYAAGRDVVDSGFVLEGRERVADVQVVLTNKLTHLTGSVTDDSGAAVDGAYVEVFSDDPAEWTLHSRYRASVVFDGTSFKVDGLPPGDYFAVALTEPPADLDLLAPDVMAGLRKAGTAFSLKEGDTRSIALKAAGTL